MLEGTPLAVGQAAHTTAAFDGGAAVRGARNVTVGGYIEPAAFGCAPPAAGLAAGAADGVLAVPFDAWRAQPNDDEADLPARPSTECGLTVADAIGMSSWAPGAAISSVAPLGRALNVSARASLSDGAVAREDDRMANVTTFSNGAHAEEQIFHG